MSLNRYRMSPYFAGLSAHAAESGSLSLRAACLLLLPSDLAVASDALAIRIDFPLFGVSRTSFSPPGLPAYPFSVQVWPPNGYI